MCWICFGLLAVILFYFLFRPHSWLQEIPVTVREESGFLCFHSRRYLTPQAKLECNPEIPVATGEELGVSGHKPRWGLFALQWLESNSQLPLATRMEIGLSWGNTRGSLCSRRNSRIPLQLKKNQEVPPSSRVEAVSHCSISREIPRSLLKFATVLDTLDATQIVPWLTSLTREEHRVSWHNLNWGPFPLLISTWRSISLCWGPAPMDPGKFEGEMASANTLALIKYYL